MTSPLKTYYVIPAEPQSERSCQFKSVKAENSRKAAKIAIQIFSPEVTAFHVWRPENRRCDHLYEVSDLKTEWHGIPFGD